MKMNQRMTLGWTGMRVALLALCSVALIALPMMAQDSGASQGNGDGSGRGMGRGMHGDPAKMEDRQLQMMTKQLNLTPDQVTQVKGVFAESDQQLKALRDDTSIANADKRSKMMSLMQDRHAKVKAVLTDDQKTKFDAMQAKMRERREDKRGEDAPP